jgi:hypothetical protein
MSEIKQCKFCGKVLTKWQIKFCSRACAAKINNLNKKHSEETKRKISISLGGNGNTRIKSKDKKCLYCGNNIKAYKFCNNACQQKFKQKVLWEEWEKTGIAGSSVKNYLINKYGYKCSICGLEKWNNEKIPLVLDHIDGNADNNLLNNLRLICRNCDGLLPTYTGRNVGKGNSINRSKTYYKTYSKRKFQ